jgi:hypothetical protein
LQTRDVARGHERLPRLGPIAAAVLSKTLDLLGHAERFEPVRNVLHRGHVSKGQFFTYRCSQQTRNNRSKVMPADGMSAAAKINRKNKRTSASPDWQLAREATLSSCALQCVGQVAECETRGSAKIVA